MTKSKDVDLLYSISRLLFPKYHPFWFLIYMYGWYFKICKTKKLYKYKFVSHEIFNQIKTIKSKDLNNIILVNSSNILTSNQYLSFYCTETQRQRIVNVIPVNIPHDLILGSSVLLHNLFKDQDHNNLDKHFRLLNCQGHKIKFASEVDIALISCPFEISFAVIEYVLGKYFSTPKIIYKSDIIAINLKYFCDKIFFTNNKIDVDTLYFKCKKVIVDNKEVSGGYFCVIGETAIKKSVNIQSYLPKTRKHIIRLENPLMEIPICPYGLQDHFDTLKKAVEPFLGKRKLNVLPIFLLHGKKGSGKERTLRALASHFGLHFYKINNLDISANVYAQNEQKMKHSFFVARTTAPCILTIFNFENFGKNNEGQFDERIINSFSRELDSLYENTLFPILLFCCSNEKTIPPDLQKVFLDTFTIDAPNRQQRENNLKWILDMNMISHNVNINEIADKTHGFLFDDLKALMYYAQNDAKFNNNNNNNAIITNENFLKSLDFMQLNYNESLGAPKVPKVQWSDVGGLTKVKDEIIKTINLPLKHPELLKSSGLKRSGILLFGPPGTGKTLIAKAVATECSLCFLSVKGPELLNMYVGQSEKNIREVFERARQASPCIIFFDELDSLAPNRGMSGDSGGVMDRVVSQLLAEMDGLETSTIFIIGATNRPDLVDPALLRPGRFDKLLYIGPCVDVPSKISVIKAITRKFQLHPNVDLEKIVTMCPINITGADFYGICSSAWNCAVRRLICNIQQGITDRDEGVTQKDIVVTMEDFLMSIQNVKPSINAADLKYFEKLKSELGSII